MMLAAALSLALLHVTKAQNPPVKFAVENGLSAKLTCSKGGASCRFDGPDFSSGFIEPDNGGTTQVLPTEGGVEKTIWGPQDDFATAFLQLPGCLTESCFIICQEHCFCELPDGSSCEETTSQPTSAPVARPPPEEVVCELTTAVDACPDLMRKLPVGVTCDCHNFCKGEFLSCAGGDTDCETELPDGHMMGKVLGCRVEHLEQGPSAAFPYANHLALSSTVFLVAAFMA